MPSVFLSHSSKNNRFAQRLANHLTLNGIRVWLDEAEIRVGDSLIHKIENAIDHVDYLAIILSPQSVKSNWVRKEVEMALNQEISGKRVKVLPILWQSCRIPGFLQGKIYADLSTSYKYNKNFPRLVLKIKGWEEAADYSLKISYPHNESFAHNFANRLDTQSKRIWRYIFEAISRGEINLQNTKIKDGSLVIDYSVPNNVVGIQGEDVAGIYVELKDAKLMFTYLSNDKLTLTSTGQSVLQLLERWHVPEDWIKHWGAHTGPYQD